MHPPLQPLEARTAAIVERDDLPVDQCVVAVKCGGQPVELRIAPADVVAVAGPHPHARRPARASGARMPSHFSSQAQPAPSGCVAEGVASIGRASRGAGSGPRVIARTVPPSSRSGVVAGVEVAARPGSRAAASPWSRPPGPRAAPRAGGRRGRRSRTAAGSGPANQSMPASTGTRPGPGVQSTSRELVGPVAGLLAEMARELAVRLAQHVHDEQVRTAARPRRSGSSSRGRRGSARGRCCTASRTRRGSRPALRWSLGP